MVYLVVLIHVKKLENQILQQSVGSVFDLIVYEVSL